MENEPVIEEEQKEEERSEEERKGEEQTEEEEGVTIQPVTFANLLESDARPGTRSIDVLMDLMLPISVELGRTHMSIKDILKLGQGSVVELAKLAGEPVDLLINNRKFAEGEVVVIDENFGVRITSLVGRKERLEDLGAEGKDKEAPE